MLLSMRTSKAEKNPLLLGSLFFAVAAASACFAQQAGSIDLTQITPREELRRPTPRTGDPARQGGMMSLHDPCTPLPKDSPEVKTTLVWFEGQKIAEGDQRRFEVRILNTGSIPVRIPFSPHLADLQPADPSVKFAYSEMFVALGLSAEPISGPKTSRTSNIGDGVRLYGKDDHPGTMLTLQPGEWAQIIGNEKIIDPEFPPVAGSKDAVAHMNATIAIMQNETLLTSTDEATTEQYFCLNKTQGPAIPIKLQ
jgi:hypothetical protein